MNQWIEYVFHMKYSSGQVFFKRLILLLGLRQVLIMHSPAVRLFTGYLYMYKIITTEIQHTCVRRDIYLYYDYVLGRGEECFDG